jgi:uncharacterized cupin superfamily protein
MDGVTRLEASALAAAPQVLESGALARTAELFGPVEGLTAGVWESEPFTWQTDHYPVDEVCVVLEGTIRLQYPDGTAEDVGPGQAVAIAKGTALTWHQDVLVRKYYVIRERTSTDD